MSGISKSNHSDDRKDDDMIGKVVCEKSEHTSRFEAFGFYIY